MSLPRGQLQIIVRPSVRRHVNLYPVTAYIAGTPVEGRGKTVWDAIDDLLSDARAGKITQQLEQEIAELEGRG